MRPALTALVALIAACGTPPDGTGGATSSTGGTGDATGGSSSTDATSSTESSSTSSGSSSSTGSEVGGETSDSGCDFVCAPDFCPVDCEGFCDVFAQDCARGDKCAAFDHSGMGWWDSTKCVPVAGDGQHGEPCTTLDGPMGGEDTCAKGHMCLGLDPRTTEGVCVALCADTPEDPGCAPPGTECMITPGAILNLCLPPCDPLGADCGPNTHCVAAGGGFYCMPAGQQEEQVGAPCGHEGQCAGGLFCSEPEAFPHPGCGESGCCAPLCESDAPTCPGEPPGLVCEPWYPLGEAPAGLEEVGACVVPEG